MAKGFLFKRRHETQIVPQDEVRLYSLDSYGNITLYLKSNVNATRITAEEYLGFIDVDEYFESILNTRTEKLVKSALGKVPESEA